MHAGSAPEVFSSLRLLRTYIEQTEARAVRSVRREGATWADIAGLLGVTRQSAWERWHTVFDTTSDVRTPTAPDLDLCVELVVADLLSHERSRSQRPSLKVRRLKADDTAGALAVDLDRDGIPYFGMWGLARGMDHAWQLTGGSYLGPVRQTAKRPPWLVSGGWSDEDEGSFGGIPADPRVARVTIVDPLGTVHEDQLESGVALFFGVRWIGAALQNLFAEDGQLLYSGPLF